MTVNLESVVKAVNSLGTNPEADKLLIDFERTAEAWKVSYDLLASSGDATIRFFGAKMLYSKAQRDHIQLDHSSSSQLKTALVQQLLSLAADPNTQMNVCRYVCLAISALAIQSLESNVVSEILKALNGVVATRPLLILETLCVLTEECGDRMLRITRDQRSAFHQQLTGSAQEVFSFLDSLLGADMQTNARILSCLRSWIENTNVPCQFILTAPVFGKAMQCFSMPELVVEASDVMIAAVKQLRRRACRRDGASRDEEERHMLALSQHVLALRQYWTAINDKYRQGRHNDGDWDDLDINSCRALADVFHETFMEFTDAYMDGTLPGLTELMAQLILCVKFPADFTVSRIPLETFYQLTIILSVQQEDEYLYFDGDDDGSDDRGNRSDSQGRNASPAIETFRPYFVSLLDTCLRKMHLEAGDLNSFNPSSEETCRERKEWQDAVADCCRILGGIECLRLVSTVLEKDQSPVTVEACFFAVERISDYLPNNEAHYLPLFVEFLSSLPPVPKLTLAAMDFLGNIGAWIAAKPKYVERFVPLLLGSLDQRQLQGSAAYALFRMCCARAAPTNVPPQLINSKLEELRNSSRLSEKAEELLLKGLSTLISKVRPYPTSASLLGTVFTSMTFRLEPGNLGSMSPGALYHAIDSITNLVDSYDVPESAFNDVQTHPVLLIFDASWSFLQSALSLGSDKLQIHEKATRFYKHVIRRVGAEAFSTRLSPMLTHIVAQYSETGIPSYLYLATICIKDFISVQGRGFSDMLCNAVSTLSAAFFTRHPSAESLQAAPESVEEFMFLMVLSLRHFGDTILAPAADSVMRRVVSSALTGLEIPDQDVQRACHSFFEAMVCMSRRLQYGVPTRDAASRLTMEFQTPLVCALILNVAGRIPAFAICLDRGTGGAPNLLWELKKVAGDATFHACLSSVVASLPSNCHKYADVLSKLQEARESADIRSVLIDFERCCRVY